MNSLLLKLLSIFIFLTSLSSCVTILSSSHQEVKIITSNPKTKVFYKDSLFGTGNEVVVNLPRDRNAQQLRFELDSHKTTYKVLVPKGFSKNYFLNLFFIPLYYPLIEPSFSYKIKTYDDFYEINDKVYKTPYWDNSKKRIYIDNISMKINKDSNTIRVIDYDNYREKYKEKKTKELDSMNFDVTNYHQSIYNKILRKGNFVDTTNTIFMDNVNNIIVSGKITRLINYSIDTDNHIDGSKLNTTVVTELGTFWYLKDTFGDTLYTKNIYSKSGEYFVPHGLETETIELAFEDALHISFLELLNDEKFNELTQREIIKNETFEKIILTKGFINPTNIDEAMEASFTIKMKDGHGSGFLVSKDGFLITNHHVVNNGSDFKAVDQNGKEYEIKVIRSNKNLDLALCKIEGDFKFAFDIPSEKNFTTGSDIFAVGTPKSLELGQSVTKGVISGYRTNPNNNSKIIQTDAKINRGNSGGAVITNNGKLVGVVDYKIFGVGVEGLSFAIGATEIKNGLGIE